MTCNSPQCFDLILPKCGPTRQISPSIKKKIFRCPPGEKAKARETQGNIRLSHVPKKNPLLESEKGRVGVVWSSARIRNWSPLFNSEWGERRWPLLEQNGGDSKRRNSRCVPTVSRVGEKPG